MDDDGESVKLTFGTLPAGVSAGSTDETTVSITDDDVPSVTVAFGAASYSVAESDDASTTMVKENEATVTVALSADPERTVTIPITKTDQGGATSADYSGVPANVVFNSGETSKTFTFAAMADTIDDDGESVKLAFGTLPAGVSAGSTGETTVSINDDDVPSVTVAFEQSSYTVAEGSSVTVKVKLSAAPERSVEIPISKTNQGGATSADYSGVPASLTFGAADTEKTITFAAASDDVDDDGESVDLGFGTLPAGVSAGSISTASVSISDDDVPSVTVSFGAAAYSVAESDDASTTMVKENEATVTVSLSADPERTVTIPITKTNQGGATSADYSGVPASLTFNSGDTSKTFTFAAAADTVDDDGESVKLTFGTLPAGVSAGSTDETTVSINNDDVPSVTVAFEQSSYTVAEGSSVTVKVKLSVAPERSVEIPISKTNQGGATSADYSGVPASLTFGAADTEKTITFAAASDDVDDDGESVDLGFGTLPAGVSAGSISTASVSISDDDVPSVTVSFGAAAYSVAESDDASTTMVKENEATVTVSLSADPERTVTIPITKTNQGGATSADYSGVPASLTFNSGDTSKTFTFAAAADTVDDDGESVKLTFGTLPAGVSAGSTDETTVSINDDDVPSVTVAFGSASYSVAESDDASTTTVKENEATVTVSLSADPERTVAILIGKTNQGGATSADYSGVPANVVFNSGDTSKTFTFAATSDTVDDDGESVKLTFGTLPAGVSAGSTDETTVSITDDDVPSVTVAFGAASYSVAESDDASTTMVKENEATVTVALSADPERTVTIPITKTDQGGATSADYSGVPANVVFNSGETSKTFTFAAMADTIDDDGESVKLAFGTLPAGVSAGSTGETTVSINDDDVPSVTVAFEQSSYTVAEGSSVTVKVKLSAAPERSVEIPISKTNQGGATSADYSGVPASLTFGAADTEKTITFAAASDDVDDDGESVKLTFGSLPTGVSGGTTNEATVSITDDDVPSVRVSGVEVSPETLAVPEGGSNTFTVALTGNPGSDLTVSLVNTQYFGQYGDPGAVWDKNAVTVSPDELTFTAGSSGNWGTAQTVTVSAPEDDDSCSEQLVILLLVQTAAGDEHTSPDYEPVGGSGNAVTGVFVTVVDNDSGSCGGQNDDVGEARPTTLTLVLGDDASEEFTVDEKAGDVIVTATLDAPAPDGGVSIRLHTSPDDTATRDADYTLPESIAIPAGERSGTGVLTVVDDALDEDDETVNIVGVASLFDGDLTGKAVLTITDDDPCANCGTEGDLGSVPRPPEEETPQEKYADLIAKMKEWRNDPCCVRDQAHTDRWDRALLAFSETVVDTTLTPMPADEAQEFADRGWTRWVEVAAALREIESGGQDDTPNQEPTVSSAIADVTIVKESGTHQVSLAGVFDDADNDSLTITATSSAEAVATVTMAPDYDSLTVSAHSRGFATITVTADDGNGGTVSDTFTVRVKAAPVVAQALADVTGLEVGATQEVSLSGVFSDADGDTLTITATFSDEVKATVSVASDGSRLTLAGVAEGTTTITVTAEDSDGNRVSTAFEVPVARKHASLIARMKEWRNDPCCVRDQAHTDRWDRALLAFGETVADTSLTPMTADEAQEFADRGWTRWVEVAAALREIESGGQDDTPNQEPTVSSAIADATIVNEGGTLEVSLSGVFSDADNDPLTITAVSDDEAVATVSVAPDYATLTVTANSRGTATITVTAVDGNGGTVSDTFTVRVKAAPVVASALADLMGLEVDATQEVSLSGVFSDADGDSLTISAASSDEAKATVSVASDGSTLTLAGVAEGTPTITVTAEDADGNRVSNAFEVEVVEAEVDHGEPPVVENLSCVAETGRVAFLWDSPEWSGGETYAYDYELTLPGGRSESGRLIGGTVLLRPGEYQAGDGASVSVKAVYELADGSNVSSDAETLTCTVG